MSTRPLRVVILGNSVALRVRPPRATADEGTYAEWLRRLGYDVRVVARAGVVAGEMFRTLEDDVVTAFPDRVILNLGVVEVCTRRTVRWLNNRPIRNYYLNAVLGTPFVFPSRASRVMDLAWRLVNGLTRRGAALAGLEWQWLPLPRFRQVLSSLIEVLLKETGAGIVVLGINPTSPRINERLPGSPEAIAKANAVLEALCGELGPRVRFLAPTACFGDLPLELAVPDGIHFSAGAHRRVAERLAALLAGETGPPSPRGAA